MALLSFLCISFSLVSSLFIASSPLVMGVWIILIALSMSLCAFLPS